MAENLMVTSVARFDGTNGSSGTTLLRASDGNLYGVSEGGGDYRLGTVFRFTPAGELSAIASFDGTNGGYLHGGLTQAADGSLYGASDLGGSQTSGSVFTTYGTIYRVTTNGVITTLHSFNNADGANPFAKLTLARDGSFYGVTPNGGDYTNSYGVRMGTIFRITTNGDFTQLLSFNGANGAEPCSELLETSNGDFYGTASRGGAADQGLVFRITTNGEITTLATFYGTNGASPEGGLVFHSDGFFYGTTRYGGTTDHGTIFRMNTNGLLTTLVSLDGNNGAEPRAALVPVSDSLFYGTAQYGGILPNGQLGFGSVFQVTTNGVISRITSFSFQYWQRGNQPLCTLCKASDGRYYGANMTGTGDLGGSIFRLEPAISPTIQSVTKTNNTTTLRWSAVPWQLYKVEYTTSLEAPTWISLDSFGNLTLAEDTTASVRDFGSAAQRFYRVVLVP